MTAILPEQGFGLICDPSGRILDLVDDELHLDNVCCGSHLRELLDIGSAAKLQGFLDVIQKDGLAFDWELDVIVGGNANTMHFAGSVAKNTFFICGVGDRGGLPQYLARVFSVARERGELRDAIFRLHGKRAGESFDAKLLDELTAVNNELVNLQRELHTKNRQLQQLNLEKNRAMGIVAHDLRNPISLISVYAAYLETVAAERLGSDELEMVRSIDRTARSMSNLVGDVLDAAAIESGKLNLTLKPIDLAALVRDVVARFQTLGQGQSVTISLDIALDCECNTCADAGKLDQVFSNLIDNAVKFSPAGGLVEVKVAFDEHHVRLSVSDSGPGLSPEMLQRMFHPFVAGNSEGERGKSGTGLGLFIARRIVEGHGGSICATSNETGGALFGVSLPRIQEARAAT